MVRAPPTSPKVNAMFGDDACYLFACLDVTYDMYVFHTQPMLAMRGIRFSCLRKRKATKRNGGHTRHERK